MALKSVSRARVIFYKGSQDHSIYEQILDYLVRQPATPVESWIKAGSILPFSGDVSKVNYSPYREGEGRNLKAWTSVPSYERELAIRQKFTEELLLGKDSSVPRDLLDPRTTLDCLTFSSLSDENWETVARIAKTDPSYLDSGVIDLDRYLTYQFLWGRLIATAMVTGSDLLIEAYEPPMDFVETSTDPLSFVFRCPAPPPPATGFFYVAGSDVAVSEHAQSVRLARDLTVPQVDPPPVSLRTPATTLFNSMPSRLRKRPSKLDQSDAASVAERPLPRDQFPDPDQVLSKVDAYLLDPEHLERKWIGFATMGYMRRDASELRWLIMHGMLSELQFNDFRVNADKSVQASVKLFLPRKYYGFFTMQSAWTLKGRFGLSTAWVEYSADTASAGRLLQWPTKRGDEGEHFVDMVINESRAYGRSVADSVLQARGALVIPLRTPASHAMLSALRRHWGSSIQEVRQGKGRTAAVRWFLPMPISSETQVWGAYRMAQALMGAWGVDAEVEVQLD